MNADVLFIHPGTDLCESEKAVGGYYSEPTIPFGLVSVAATISQGGLSIYFKDYAQDPYDLEPIEQLLSSHRPRVVAITGSSESRFNVLSLARAVKRSDSAIKVVLGGAHATFAAIDVLTHCPEVDAIVLGEGEATAQDLFLAFANGRSPSGIPGVALRENGVILSGQMRERIRNLDSLPGYREYDKIVDLKKYVTKSQITDLSAMSLVTSRGCPMKCTFCTATLLWNRKVTFMSPEKVVDEMLYLRDRFNIRVIKIHDALFTMSRERLESICALLIEKGKGLQWECEIRASGPGSVDYDTLKRMKQAGCYMVSFGLESISSDVLRNVSKGVTVEDAERTALWCKGLGIKTKIFLMCGLPGETKKSARQTLKWRERWRKGTVDLIPYAPTIIYPGTKIEELAHLNGCLGKEFSWCEAFEVPFHSTYLHARPTMPVFLQPTFGYPDYFKAMRIFSRQAGYEAPLWKKGLKFFRVRSIDDVRQNIHKAVREVKHVVLGRY